MSRSAKETEILGATGRRVAARAKNLRGPSEIREFLARLAAKAQRGELSLLELESWGRFARNLLACCESADIEGRLRAIEERLEDRDRPGNAVNFSRG